MLVFLSTGRISCFSMSLILDFWCSDTLGLCWVVLSVAGAVTEPWLGFIYDTEQERSVQLSLESLGMAPRAWERSRKLGNGPESLGMAPRVWEWPLQSTGSPGAQGSCFSPWQSVAFGCFD